MALEALDQRAEEQKAAELSAEIAEASRELRSDQVHLARSASGQVWFGDRKPFCLECGATVSGDYTAWFYAGQGRAKLDIPLCATHLSRARAWRYAAWVSLVCYPGAIVALTAFREELHLDDLPEPWIKVVVAVIFLPMIALWWKKDHAPLSAKVDLLDGGTRVILTYPHRAPKPSGLTTRDP